MKCINFFCERELVRVPKKITTNKKLLCHSCVCKRGTISVKCKFCNEILRNSNLNNVCKECKRKNNVMRVKRMRAALRGINLNDDRWCQYCKERLDKASHMNKQFCSKKCYRRWYLENIQKPEEFKKQKTAICERTTCNNSLMGRRLGAKYCSVSCCSKVRFAKWYKKHGRKR